MNQRHARPIGTFDVRMYVPFQVFPAQEKDVNFATSALEYKQNTIDAFFNVTDILETNVH